MYNKIGIDKEHKAKREKNKKDVTQYRGNDGRYTHNIENAATKQWTERKGKLKPHAQVKGEVQHEDVDRRWSKSYEHSRSEGDGFNNSMTSNVQAGLQVNSQTRITKKPSLQGRVLTYGEANLLEASSEGKHLNLHAKLGSGVEAGVQYGLSRNNFEATAGLMAYAAKAEVGVSSQGCVDLPYSSQQLCGEADVTGTVYSGAIGGRIGMGAKKKDKKVESHIRLGIGQGVIGAGLDATLAVSLRPKDVLSPPSSLTQQTLIDDLKISQTLLPSAYPRDYLAAFKPKMCTLGERALHAPGVIIPETVQTARQTKDKFAIEGGFSVGELAFSGAKIASTHPSSQSWTAGNLAILSEFMDKAGEVKPGLDFATATVIKGLQATSIKEPGLAMASVLRQAQQDCQLNGQQTDLLGICMQHKLQQLDALEQETINFSKLEAYLSNALSTTSVSSPAQSLTNLATIIHDDAKAAVLGNEQSIIHQAMMRPQYELSLVFDAADARKIKQAELKQHYDKFALQFTEVAGVCGSIAALAGNVKAARTITSVGSSMAFLATSMATWSSDPWQSIQTLGQGLGGIESRGVQRVGAVVGGAGTLALGAVTFAANPFLGAVGMVKGALSILGGFLGGKKKNDFGAVMQQGFQQVNHGLRLINSNLLAGFDRTMQHQLQLAQGLSTQMAGYHAETMDAFNQVFYGLAIISKQQAHISRQVEALSRQVDEYGMRILKGLEAIFQTMTHGFTELSQQMVRQLEYLDRRHEIANNEIKLLLTEQNLQQIQQIQRQEQISLHTMLNTLENLIDEYNEQQQSLVETQRTKSQKILSGLEQKTSFGESFAKCTQAALTGEIMRKKVDIVCVLRLSGEVNEQEPFAAVNILRDYLSHTKALMLPDEQKVLAQRFVHVGVWHAVLEKIGDSELELSDKQLEEFCLAGYELLAFCHLVAQPKVIEHFFANYHAALLELAAHFNKEVAKAQATQTTELRQQQSNVLQQQSIKLAKIGTEPPLDDYYQGLKDQNEAIKSYQLSLTTPFAYLPRPLSVLMSCANNQLGWPVPQALLTGMPVAALQLEAMGCGQILFHYQLNEQRLVISAKLEVGDIASVELLQSSYALPSEACQNLEGWLKDHWHSLADGKLAENSGLTEQLTPLFGLIIAKHQRTIYRSLYLNSTNKDKEKDLLAVAASAGLLRAALALPFAACKQQPMLAELASHLLEYTHLFTFWRQAVEQGVNLAGLLQHTAGQVEKYKEWIIEDIADKSLYLQNPELESALAVADSLMLRLNKDMLAFYQQRLILLPDDAYLLTRIAICQAALQQDLTGAAQQTELALRQRPSDMQLRYQQANLHLAQNQPMQALAEYRWVLEQQRDYIESLQTNKSAEKAAEQQVLAEAFAGYLQTMVRVGDGFALLGYPQVSDYFYQYVLNYLPDEAVLLAKQAFVCEQQQAWTAAYEGYGQALKLDATQLSYWEGRARVAQQLQRYQEALEIYQALAVEPVSLALQFRIAYLSYKTVAPNAKQIAETTKLADKLCHFKTAASLEDLKLCHEWFANYLNQNLITTHRLNSRIEAAEKPTLIPPRMLLAYQPSQQNRIKTSSPIKPASSVAKPLSAEQALLQEARQVLNWQSLAGLGELFDHLRQRPQQFPELYKKTLMQISQIAQAEIPELELSARSLVSKLGQTMDHSIVELASKQPAMQVKKMSNKRPNPYAQQARAISFFAPVAALENTSKTSGQPMASLAAMQYDTEIIHSLIKAFIEQDFGGFAAECNYLLHNQFADYFIAVTPPIDKLGMNYQIAGISSLPVDYYLNRFSRPQEAQNTADVFDELMPKLLNTDHNQAKIIFPYNLSDFHWLTGEIVINKRQHSYTISYTVYDPFGAYEELPAIIKDSVELRIKSFDPQAEITSSSPSLVVSKVRQAASDADSCGVITVEDTLRRIANQPLDITYPWGACELRERHIECLSNKQIHASLRKKLDEQLTTVSNMFTQQNNYEFSSRSRKVIF